MNVVFENHLLTWLASILCCLAVIALLRTQVSENSAVYSSNLFLPTYFVGIVAWLLHGIEIGSYAVVVPCCAQLIVILYLFRNMLVLRSKRSEK